MPAQSKVTWRNEATCSTTSRADDGSFDLGPLLRTRSGTSRFADPRDLHVLLHGLARQDAGMKGNGVRRDRRRRTTTTTTPAAGATTTTHPVARGIHDDDHRQVVRRRDVDDRGDDDPRAGRPRPRCAPATTPTSASGGPRRHDDDRGPQGPFRGRRAEWRRRGPRQFRPPQDQRGRCRPRRGADGDPRRHLDQAAHGQGLTGLKSRLFMTLHVGFWRDAGGPLVPLAPCRAAAAGRA